MSDYTRLTVAGSARRIEVVVPSTEPLGTALPGLIQLLDEPTGTVARPLTLVAADGEQLELDRSPQDQELPDGASIRLVRIDAAPPPPAVIDLVDVAAEARDGHPGQWDDRAARAVGLVATGFGLTGAGLLLPLPPVAAFWTVAGTGLLLALAAAGTGLAGRTRLAPLLSAAAAGLALVLGVIVAGWWPLAIPAYAGALAAIAALSVVLGLGLGVGRRSRGALAGAGTGLLASALGLTLLASGLDAARVAELLTVLAVFGTGSLPWVALSVSGLTGLDDQAAEGRRVARPLAIGAVGAAFSTLTWSVAAFSVVLAVSGWVLLGAANLWSWLIAAVAVVATLLRTRAFPLRAQAWVMWGAVAAIALALVPAALVTPYTWAAVAGFGLLAVVAVAATLARPRPHQRARLRGLGNLVETLSVVALLPLLLGGFGLYADLLGLFGGAG